MQRGEYIVALQETRLARNQILDPKSEWYWHFRSLEAEIMMLQGHYRESLDLLRFSLPETLQNSDTAARQRMTQSAASAFLFQSDDARKYFDDAAKVIHTSQPGLLGDLTLLEGTLAFLTGDSRTAYSRYLSARDFARSNKDPFLEAAAVGSLGLAATGLERYDESIDWNQQALQLSTTIGARNSLGKIEGNTGWSYHELGDLDNALHQFELAETEAEHSENVSDQSYWLNSEAGVLYDLHDYTRADSISKKALPLARGVNDMRTLIECLQIRALIAMARSDTVEAQRDIDEALRLGPAAPDPNRDVSTALLGAQLVANAGNLERGETLYTQITHDPHAPTSVRWEALAGLAQVHAAQGKVAVAEKEYAQSIDTISKAKEAVEREDFQLSFLSSAIRFYDQYVNFLLAQNRPLDALKIADLSRAQTLEHGLSPSVNADAGGKSSALPKSVSVFAIHPQETARRLGATLLFYQLGQEGSHLWVISPAKITLRALPSAGEIDALVASYRRSILEDPRDLLESVNASGKKLYEMLIQPVENVIPKGSRVIILPDGPLRSLNFESLPVYGPNPHYWLEDATVTVASSLSLLSRVSNSRPPKSPNLLFFGDPDPPAKEFPRLGDASEEIRAVQNHFDEKGTTSFLKKDATASAYLSSDPGKYSYLHFATHGIASVTRPLESAIILNREGDSYKLYARDIVQHPLNAYLVSISACDGSGKRNFAGEGLIGLSWAFLRAGAHNVVAGLWETSTASTPQIMDRLYQGLSTGEDPAAALRNAKLALVHAKGTSRRPFYWAPFQLYVGS